MSTVIVFDSNREALARRLRIVRELAPPPVQVIGVTSRTAALLHAESAEPGTPILVDLLATDRLVLDRPGERLIRRLRRSPRTQHVCAYAWSAHVAPEVIRGARDAGASGFVVAGVDDAAERAALAQALRGQPVWPTEPLPATPRHGTWEAWFHERFSLTWQAWMEPMLVRLASGEERAAVADELVGSGAARSRNQAAARMREVARAIAGEHSNSPSAVAPLAQLVLAQLAAHRPLAEQPAVHVSVEQAAATIAAAPSLVRAAGLTADEVQEITAIDAMIVTARATSTSSAGAPPADRVKNERRWAAGRRALELGAGRGDVDTVIAGILARLQEALVALEDARLDELYHPEARAAAALRLLAPQHAAELDGVDWVGGEPTWRGRSALALAIDTAVSAADVHALSLRIDTAVRARASA